MMISSPAASDPYAAAAALDRTLRSGAASGDDDVSPDTPSPDASPDVVVTLSEGRPSPSTYDASGRMSGPPTLDDLGANGPSSMAHASESHDGEGDTSDPTTADAHQDAAVAA